MDTAQQCNHLSVGFEGEDLAVAFLIGLGYKILDRNWRLGHKELDIVAVDSNELVAVEVKTRTEPVMDSPARSVDKKKQRNIIHATHAYVRYNRISLDVRFDIIWVIIKQNGSHKISHYKDAFIPML